MRYYEITALKKDVQELIAKMQIDNGDGIIQSDNGELASLLSATGSKDIESLVDLSTTFNNYEVNSESNIFLKEYLEKRAKKEGIKIPDGVELKISSPKNFGKEYQKLTRYVRRKIYGARLKDMLNLMTQDKEAVNLKVAGMKISEDDKNKILELKTMFDSYYKIEANYKGENINLLNPNEVDMKKLKEISPEFANFIKKEQANLKKHTVNFAQKEANSDELSKAGFISRLGSPLVMGVLGLGLYRGVKETRLNAKAAKDTAKFLAEQKTIYQAGKPLFVNPIKAFGTAIKSAKGGKAATIAGVSILGSYLAKTLLGSLDDLSGAAKDTVQDWDNFGGLTALAINIPAAAVGVLSSAFIAPTIDAHINYNRAEKYLLKNGVLPKMKGFKNVARLGGKGLVGAAFGVVIAACSSGSSWASMLGTRIKFGMNGNKLEDKNIISKEENTFKNATDNMMQYEAYYGKWDGIAKGDPTIGSIGGGLGLFTSTNPYIQNISFGLQGCSETLTACGVQLAGNVTRKNKLNKEKEALITSINN